MMMFSNNNSNSNSNMKSVAFEADYVFRAQDGAKDALAVCDITSFSGKTQPVRRPGGVFSTPLVHLVGDGDVVEGASSVEFFDGVDSDAVARDCTKSVTIHSMVPGEGGRKGREWKAVVAKSTLFVKVPASIDWEESGFGFKESVVAVMELAENVLECSELVFCLQKSRPDLTLLIRAFMFVGFEIVHPTVYNFGEDYVLVGSEL